VRQIEDGFAIDACSTPTSSKTTSPANNVTGP
jgi:hypothetical protein